MCIDDEGLYYIENDSDIIDYTHYDDVFSFYWAPNVRQ